MDDDGMANRPPLRAIRWSQARLPSAVAAATLRRRGVQVLIAAPENAGAWAVRVRALRFIPAVALPVDAVDAAALLELDAAGPLVVALTPPAAGRGSDAWRRARDVLATLRAPLLRFCILDAPPCQVAPLREDVAVQVEPVAAPVASPDPRCRPCAWQAACPGPRGADDAVTPVPVSISNQFDLVEVAPPVPLGSAGCPVPHALLPTDGALRQFLSQDGQLRSFSAPAQASSEVARALGRGQLYLDASDKARLDDFAADLRLLVHQHPPHAVAEAGRVVHCPGAWTPAAVQPFAAEETLLRQHLGALRGVVVDVGAGPVRYLAELREAADAGKLTYVAVEPDRAALQRTAAALPAAGCVQASGERLPLRDACADAVLFLRSFNHLRDVGAALGEAARVLKPGGTLLLCDNVAFGLLRTPEQLARAHAVPVTETPFEHFRNADAAMAAAALDPARFGDVRCHEVGPGRSNQWLVLARRVDLSGAATATIAPR